MSIPHLSSFFLHTISFAYTFYLKIANHTTVCPLITTFEDFARVINYSMH